MSSKLEEIKPLSLSNLVEKACHNKFTKEDIRQMEINILKLFEFKLL